MKVAVAYAREVECRNAGGDRDGCHGQWFASNGPGSMEMVSFGNWLIDTPTDQTPVLTLCHNPVRSTIISMFADRLVTRLERAMCAATCSLYWPYDSRAPWGGIADWNGDPLTGEIIGGMAMVMGRSVRYASAFIRDVLQVAMGDMTLENIVDGLPQDTYFSSEANFKAIPSSALPAAEIQSRVKAIDAKHAAASMGIKPLSGGSMAEQMSSYTAMKTSQIFDPVSEAAAVAAFDSSVTPLLGTQIETNVSHRNGSLARLARVHRR